MQGFVDDIEFWLRFPSLAIPLHSDGPTQFRHGSLLHLCRLALIPEVLRVLHRCVAGAATQVCACDLPALV